MTERTTDPASPSEAAAVGSCFLLDKIPPELRVHIYDYLVVFSRRLVPYCSTSGIRPAKLESGLRRRGEGLTHPIDTALFLLNKQIYEESADVFYGKNRFSVHYDYFCTCWSGKHALHLNKGRIKHFKIQAVNLDHEDPILWARCKMCATDGFGLLKYLNSFPILRSVTLAFANEESFSSCAASTSRKLRKLAKAATLEATEIGRLHVTGAKGVIELRLPSLFRAWPVASSKATEHLLVYDSDNDDAPIMRELSELKDIDMNVYTALRDILYHAYAIRETTRELRPFMQKVISSNGVQIERLNARERAQFSAELAGCLSDMISDDGNVEMADRSDLVEL